MFFPIPPLSMAMLKLKPDSSPIRFKTVFICCAANTPVGDNKAACLPFTTHRNSALSAISVFPKPTSPQTRRSIGRLLHTMSFSTASKHLCWSGVGSNANVFSKSRIVTVITESKIVREFLWKIENVIILPRSAANLPSFVGSNGARVKVSLVAYKASTSCAI